MRKTILLCGLAIVALAGHAGAADLRLEGVVLNHLGDPVAGAGVFWIRTLKIYELPVVVEGTTGSDGRFELRGEAVPAEIDVGRNSVWVHAEGHGLISIKAAKLLVANQGGQTPVVALPAPGATAIRVTANAAGQPLAGVRVEPVLPLLPAALLQLQVRTSDQFGQVRFPAIPAGTLRQVRIVSDELGTQLFDLAGGRFGEQPLPVESTIVAQPTGRVDV